MRMPELQGAVSKKRLYAEYSGPVMRSVLIRLCLVALYLRQ